MKKTNIIIVIALISIMAISYGCAKHDASDNKVLATFGNKTITMKDFKASIAKLPAYYRDVVEKSKKRYLEELIAQTIMYEDAIRKGVDKDPEVIEILNEAKKKVVIAKFIKNEVEAKLTIPEEDIKKFYDSHKDDFKTVPMWRASHILVADEAKAADLRDQILKGASFEELAKANSIDATSGRGGDIGYFRTGQVVPEFESVCLKMSVGDMSEVVHTKFGYHIIKLTDKKEPSVESYEKVKRLVEAELKRKKRAESFDRMMASLKEKYNVRIEGDALKLIDGMDKKKETAAK